MYLARIRASATSDFVLVARFGDAGHDGIPDVLFPLTDALGAEATDPVAVATNPDMLAAARSALAAASRANTLSAAEVEFGVPTPTCTKVCCLALNYRAHAEESNLEVPQEPVLFFKPPSSLTAHGMPVKAPARTRHLEHEVELAVVIGREARDVPAENWQDVVAGYTVINDITARDLQLRNMERNLPWDQAKGFDTFAPVGPYLATVDEVPDPHDLQMTLSVGGEIRQSAHTSLMIFSVPKTIADLSDGMTLLPGDIIATGTTAGIAPLSDGDVMVSTIANVGTLVNEVCFESEQPEVA